MTELRPAACPISGETESHRVFVYHEAPAGEIGFRRLGREPYHREVWQFARSKHYVSCHSMSAATDYNGAYVDATYQDEAGIHRMFERIIALPREKSDNAGRIERVHEFIRGRAPALRAPRLLDVGAGLGVFPHAVKRAGWSCTAIDPDERAVRHLRERIGVDAIHGDFMQLTGLGSFDIVTLNKVLEHVGDPVGMLARVHSVLVPGGIVYVEVPDGEAAAAIGPHREEFFIEHLHVFSFISVVMLAERAGFVPLLIERLCEPSTKYTLRAFLAPRTT
jgi:2-polyprenyl-3-methyl-5-hydroxy-6-metoxy-1,4-benzoquinol methylase